MAVTLLLVAKFLFDVSASFTVCVLLLRFITSTHALYVLGVSSIMYSKTKIKMVCRGRARKGLVAAAVTRRAL